MPYSILYSPAGILLGFLAISLVIVVFKYRRQTGRWIFGLQDADEQDSSNSQKHKSRS